MLPLEHLKAVHTQLCTLHGIKTDEKLAVSASGTFSIDTSYAWRGVARRLRRDGVDVTIAALNAFAVELSYISIRFHETEEVRAMNWSPACEEAAHAVTRLSAAYDRNGVVTRVGELINRVAWVIRDCGHRFELGKTKTATSPLIKNETAPIAMLCAEKFVNTDSENTVRSSEILDTDAAACASEILDTDAAACASEILDTDAAACASEILDTDAVACASEILDTDAAACASEIHDTDPKVEPPLSGDEAFSTRNEPQVLKNPLFKKSRDAVSEKSKRNRRGGGKIPYFRTVVHTFDKSKEVV